MYAVETFASAGCYEPRATRYHDTLSDARADVRRRLGVTRLVRAARHFDPPEHFDFEDRDGDAWSAIEGWNEVTAAEADRTPRLAACGGAVIYRRA
jgi:hypothetical protein